MKRTLKFLLLFAALLTFLNTPLIAQTTGSISGEVKDEKQAVVTNADGDCAERENQRNAFHCN